MSSQQTAPDLSHVHPLASPPRMYRLNGIGTTIAGRHNDPAMAPWYYKQLVWTVLFIPVFLGQIYVVSDAGMGRGWYFHGTVTGAEFAERYGTQAYWAFKARVLFGAVALIVAIVGIAISLSFIVPFFQGKR